MRRLGAIALALVCAATAWGAGTAAADTTPGPGITLSKVGVWYDGVPSDLMAVDAAGTQWATTYGASTYRTRPAGGTWSAPRALPGALPNHGLHVAAGRPGTAVAAYVGPNDSQRRYVAAQVRRTNGTWTAPYRLSSRTVDTRFRIQAVGNADGDYAVAWSERPQSGTAREQVKVGIFLRGDRWRVHTVGPGGDVQVGMDAAGAVYVARTYRPSGGSTQLIVQRTKRPGRAMSAATSFGRAPVDEWQYLVETTGRQTVAATDEGEAWVLHQETLGGPMKQVWRKDDVRVQAAVGGSRLRVTWADPGTGTFQPGTVWTQVLRPTAGPAVAIGSARVLRVGMDKLGRGMLTWREGLTVHGRAFSDAGLGEPFPIVSEDPEYPDEDMSAVWLGWTAAEGHLLQVRICTDCGLLPEEGGGPPYAFGLYATQVEG